MVDCQRPTLTVIRQCALLGISRSSVYYRPVRACQEDLKVHIDAGLQASLEIVRLLLLDYT